MNHALLDTTQVICNITLNGAAQEVCVEAIARHDRSSNMLTVELSAFLRSEDTLRIGEKSMPPWLPAPQTVTEHVAAEEAHEMALDVFASWRRKVAETVPR